MVRGRGGSRACLPAPRVTLRSALFVHHCAGGVNEDPRKFQMTKTGALRFISCAQAWNLSTEIMEKQIAWAKAGATEAEWVKDAATLVPKKYLEGRIVGAGS